MMFVSCLKAAAGSLQVAALGGVRPLAAAWPSVMCNVWRWCPEWYDIAAADTYERPVSATSMTTG
jgi:hypothetical protein